MWLVAPALAHAGGGRKIPDLRRDAARLADPRGEGVLRLPITLHVATDDGEPVMSRAAAQAWVRRANQALAPYGLSVEVVAVRRMPAGWSEVTRWQSRRALAGYAPPDGTIHVFAIDALDDGRRMRRIRGLHWRYRGLTRSLRGREYVVVTTAAPSTTFAHEIGHLFGLRHTTRVDNIMCSCRRSWDIGFTGSQGLAMREGARRFIARQGSIGVAALRSRDRRR